MTREERAILQERVKTLVLGHALEATLERFVKAADAAGRDAGADLTRLEDMLVTAAGGLADRAVTEKFAVLVAVEDATAIVKTAFAAARATLTDLRGPGATAVAA